MIRDMGADNSRPFAFLVTIQVLLGVVWYNYLTHDADLVMFDSLCTEHRGINVLCKVRCSNRY